MQTIRLVPLALAFILSPAPKRQAVLDQPFVLTRLRLDLSVEYGSGTLTGSAGLTLRNASQHPVDAVSLLLGRLMTVQRVSAAGGAALAFTQQVGLFADDPSYQVNHLVVSPVRPLAPGESITVTIRYHGVLVGYTETGSLYIKDHVSPEFTILREDALAFPVAGVLARQVNRRAARESFGFDAAITVPSGQIVAMGGEQIAAERHDSVTTWRYRSSDPVPFLNITIAPYRVLEVPGARIFHFVEDTAGAALVGTSITGALDRFSRWFGPLARQPMLAVMEIPDGYGSQASLTAGIIQTADAFRDRSELRQLYHELSHLWNAPDREHPSPRWNEGLASFLEFRMAGELDGWTDWDGMLERRIGSLLRRCVAPVQCGAIPLARFGEAGMTDLSYSTGLVLFYALDRVLGPDRFNRAYREYFQSHLNGGSTAELAAVFREAGPLTEPILQDWLLTPRWYTRLSSGEALGAIIEGYRKP